MMKTKTEFVNSEISINHVAPGMYLIRPRNCAYNNTKYKAVELLQVAEISAKNSFYHLRWAGDEKSTAYHAHMKFTQVQMVMKLG